MESGMEILSNKEMFGSTWGRKAKFIERICRERKIDWLILDTFFEIVGFDREQESDAATVNAAARPVRRIASQLKCTATLNRHERKSGGDVGTSERDSNALDGTVDIIARVRQLPGNHDLQKREVEIISRIEGVRLTIELPRDTKEYIVASREEILDSEIGQTAVPADPFKQGPDVIRVVAFVKSRGTTTREEIRGKDGAGMMRARAVKAIEEALKAGLIHQDSEGFINAT